MCSLPFDQGIRSACFQEPRKIPSLAIEPAIKYSEDGVAFGSRLHVVRWITIFMIAPFLVPLKDLITLVSATMVESFSTVFLPVLVASFSTLLEITSTLATTAFDIAQSRSAGQSFTITRVGEWLLVHIGANVDVSKNNVGMNISVEPRLGRSMFSSTQLGSLIGVAQPRY